MAASEHLGRQFLDRHLVEHHGWDKSWLRDYDDDPSDKAMNEEHGSEHLLMGPDRSPLPQKMTSHSHSPEKIEFH